MNKIRPKPYHVDSFLKHIFAVQFLMVALLAAGLFSNLYLPDFWSLLSLLAIAPYLAGFALFVWASWFIEPYNRFHPPKDLASGGPYSYSRNPQFIALALMLSATALVSGSFIVSGIAALLIIYMASIGVVSEERKLKTKFGEAYEDYCSNTGRWI